MAQTTHQCKVGGHSPALLCFNNRPVTCWTNVWIFPVLQRFYGSGCCTEPTDIERKHMSRFHTRAAARRTMAAASTRKHAAVPDNKVTIICCFHFQRCWVLLGDKRLLKTLMSAPLSAVSRHQTKSSSSRFLRGRTLSLPACRSPSSRLRWSGSKLARVSTSPSVCDTWLTKPDTLKLQ